MAAKGTSRATAPPRLNPSLAINAARKATSLAIALKREQAEEEVTAAAAGEEATVGAAPAPSATAVARSATLLVPALRTPVEAEVGVDHTVVVRLEGAMVEEEGSEAALLTRPATTAVV